MKRSELIDWIKRHGYVDNGHNSNRFIKIEGSGRRYCLKVNDLVVRYEAEVESRGCEGGIERRWVRLYSGYISKLTIGEGDKLVGMKSFNSHVKAALPRS